MEEYSVVWNGAIDRRASVAPVDVPAPRQRSTDIEARVLSVLVGERTIPELVEATGYTKTIVENAIYRLREKGLVGRSREPKRRTKYRRVAGDV